MPPIPASLAPRRRPPRWLEWAVLSLVAAALVFVLEGSGLLRRPNRLLQDGLIALQMRDLTHGEVIIVVIDDKSVAALGRWPWRRSFHAALIDDIGKDGPRAIGMDLLLSEPDQRFPGDDVVLAGALARSGRVVLPSMMQNLGGDPVVVAPIPLLAHSAAGLGLVHLPIDDDGVARNVYLREGLAGRMQDHFSVAMLAAGGKGIVPAELPGLAEVERRMEDPVSGQVLAWQRSHRMIVPFAGPPGHFRHVSYVDVLDGVVPPGTFRDKFVLVGATAAGLGDLYATPVAGRPQLMSGVEISANVLDSLLGGHSIAAVPAWLDAALNLLAVLLALAGLAFLGPLAALLLTVGLIAALPLAAAIAMLGFRLQFSPAAGMLGLGLTYALWSWRRLDAATRYLVDELRQLRASGGMMPIPAGPLAPRGDFLDRRMEALRQAAQQLRDLHRFVSDSLEGLPDAVLVCDRLGTVLLANAAAARHFGVDSDQRLRGALLPVLMSDVLSQQDHQPVITVDALAAAAGVHSAAARDGRARDLLVKQVPSFSGGGVHSGWILSVVDVSALRQAERQRDDAMRFLGHDLRAPQASILTLLELRRQNPAAMTDAQFHQRLERHATKAMALSDDFIQLVRAQSSGYRIERCNLVDLLRECIDDQWETLRRRKLRIVMAPSPQEATSLIDRELVARAIGNLLGNALKFSREGAWITCAVEALGADWAVRVEDEGPGIDEALQAQLFEPFVRGRSGTQVDGAGLGLAFVRTVAQRHGGKVLLDSAPGRGSAFRLVLAQAPDAPPPERGQREAPA
ncbi:Alginate biosynthesis sensor protein KinB [Variovorax sp. SRS16]|uniref:CHASE2 domain-containing protein n=1 Tax=Variovorax sp. SRS16 TaxID=282217 RepID=UPI001318DCEB|nr:CHASE2 domain-containing protein [Variovorax sp. SRS16]VTU31857.1 Alginate biosynthesis sensor protein KinB [Variovorax sp. SRS16]